MSKMHGALILRNEQLLEKNGMGKNIFVNLRQDVRSDLGKIGNEISSSWLVF
jgi:hypothetical protein